MSAELNSVWEPLSVVWALRVLRVLSRVTVVCRIAVFFSSEELAAADGECHISCSTIPSHQSMNSFYFPSNHSTLLSSPPHPDFSTHTHSHCISVLFSDLSLPSVQQKAFNTHCHSKHHIHQCTIKLRTHPGCLSSLFSACLFGCYSFFPMNSPVNLCPPCFQWPPRQSYRQQSQPLMAFWETNLNPK